MKRTLEKPEREKAPNILYSGAQYLLIQEFDWLESHFPKFQNLKKCYEHLHHLIWIEMEVQLLLNKDI